MLPLKATYLKDQLVLRKAHIKAPVSQSQLSQCVPAMPQHQDLGTSCLCGPVGQTLGQPACQPKSLLHRPPHTHSAPPCSVRQGPGHYGPCLPGTVGYCWEMASGQLGAQNRSLLCLRHM